VPRDAVSDPAPAETPPQESRSGRGKKAWAIAIVALVLVVYPAVRWVMSRSGGTTPPAAGVATLQLSYEHYQARRYDEAVATAKAVIATNPTSADAYNNLAVSYLALQKYDDAIRAAREAIRLRPDFQLAKSNLVWILQEKAKASGQPLPAPKPDSPSSAEAGALLNQSLEHAQAKRYRECIDTATQAAKVNPGSARAFNNIGFCAGSLQLWDEAIKNTQEALRLDPGFQLARNNLAWMQQEKRKADAAKAK
jgi:tetratricopeptide (TPR) repeat protein